MLSLCANFGRTHALIVAAITLLWAQQVPASPLQILPLGDSITQGDRQHGSYRRSLWQKLGQAGVMADFIGTMTNHYDGDPLSTDYDLDHEGHGGFKVEELLGSLPEWLASYTPDVCLLHAGSNDVFQDQDNASTVNELGMIIDSLRADNPNVVVLLAKIIPRNHALYNQRISDLNAQLDGLATAKNTAASPVIVVDQNSGFDAATDTFDTIHPNEVGVEKMATRWFETLETLFSGPQVPRPPGGLQAQAGNEEVTLSWAASFSATAHNVKRSTTSGGPYATIVSNLTTTTYTDLGLVNGTTYYYVVTALNDQGESEDSTQISATPSTGPVPIVKLSFDEPSGTLTANSGSAGGTFTLTTPQPARVIDAPTNGSPGGIDMGTSSSNYAVDSPAPISALVGLNRFTLTGWLNNRSIVQGSGGNRVISCIDNGGDGFELVYKSDGSLILCVNQGPDSDSPRSSAGKIPEDFFASADNWRFFAVTYDATAAQVRFYFGSNSEDATLSLNRSYPGRGALGAGLGRLSIGHMNPATRASFLSRMFRGMIDEMQVFGMVLSQSEIISVQRGAAVAPSPPAAAFSGNPTNGSAPLTVNFTDSSSGAISSRVWNFGDGSTTNTSATTVAHTYSMPGTNTVSLTVRGPGGSNTLTRTAYIVVTNPPPNPGGGPLTRVANSTLQMPERPPVFGYLTTNALNGLSFTYPVAIASPPGETNRLFVAELGGRIIVITNLSFPTRTVFLDLSSVILGGTPSSEQGLESFVFHPGFATNGFFYVSYDLDPPAGSGIYNRLARFQVSPANGNMAVRESELVLIDHPDLAAEHNMNDLKFGPDGYLYVALGDEGPNATVRASTQHIDQDFYSAILRLDVDKRPGNLRPNPHPASSTNYLVPADNPFVGATSFNGQPVDPAQVRTEFYAVGMRNPWRLWFDPLTDFLYCGDVGHFNFEEIDVITKGGNYGWAYLEGTHPGLLAGQTPPGFTSIPPILEYAHGMGFSQGNAVVAGVVYRGQRLSQLHGAFVFADYVSGNIWQLRYDGNIVTNWQRLTSDQSIVSFGLDPRNGDVLMCDISEGKIKRLDYSPTATGPSLPPTLAQTGAFSDVQALTPHAGVVAYDLNVPFWSDNAQKSRWFSVPNVNQKIGFSPDSNWAFPTGTVWVKHFELELTNGVPSSKRRLETRLLVKNSDGVYGVTYRWGNSLTNAILVPEEGLAEPFTIRDGGTTRTQVWHYPSRVECLTCHSAVGGHAVGFNTPQLNRVFNYGSATTNQIQALSNAGYFQGPVSGIENMLALAAATNTTASLEHRTRSYLFANCAQCHQPGGSGRGYWDARITTPLSSSGLINGFLIEQGGNSINRVIKPGDPSHSMLLTRISSPSPLRMPPLDTSVFDTQSIDLVTAWIKGLLKILPLGDSITQGDSGHNSYRRPLWQMLANAGIYADFIGSLTNNSGGSPPNPDFDLDHEGHGGWRANELLLSLPGWLAGYTPDVCLLHAGSNDAYLNESTASTLAELSQIIDALRADNPKVIVLLAKLIPADDPVMRQNIIDLNSQIDGLAAMKTTAASPVIVVDQYTGFDVAMDTYDGAHPNESGEFKIAQRWFTALYSVLSGAGAPLPPSPPTLLQVMRGNNQVALTWNASVGATSYNVKRSTVSGGSYNVVASNLAATAYTDFTVVNGTTYYYVVTAHNGDAESLNSSQASATPSAGPVAIVKLSFDETSGILATNYGSSGGTFTLTTPQPARTANVPANVGGSGAIDMDTSAGNYAVDSAAPISALAGLNRLTLTLWLNNRSVVQSSSGNRVMSCIDNGGDGFELIYKGDGSLVFTLNQDPDSDSPRSSPGKIPEDFSGGPNNWRFAAVTYDSAAGEVRFYFGSNASDATLDLVDSYPGRGGVGPGLGRLSLGHMNPASRSAFISRMFRGIIDEVCVYDNVLSLAEIVAVQRQTLSAGGTTSLTNCSGSDVTLVANVSGTGPFAYQWMKNGVVLPGTTNSSYTINSVTAADAGTYCARVSSPTESVTNCTILNVLSPTTASGPISQTVCAGSTVTLATVPSGDGPFMFRWRKNGVLIPGATTNSYTRPSVVAADSGTYCVEVTGACTSVTNCATLTVLEATTATALQSLTLCPDTTARFATVPSGLGPFTYRWTKNGAPVADATNDTLTLPSITAADAGAYCVEVRGTCNGVTNCATLTVHQPTVAAGPVSQTNCFGMTASFLALASGTGPFQYQWSKDGTPLSTATNDSLVINSVTAADEGIYCVEVTGLCNSVTTCASLTVTNATTASALTSLTNCPGTSASFSTVASGAGPFTYRWRRSGALVAGATNNSLAIPSVSAADAGVYCVEVNGACNSVTNCASLTVLVPTTAAGPQSRTNCPGTTATFTTVPAGTGPFWFQWSKDGAPILEATNDTFTLPAVSAADAGIYCVKVNGACGSATNCATLTVLTPTTANGLASLTHCSGSSAIFTTVAGGSPDPSAFHYRWTKNGVPINNATNSTFSIMSVNAGNNGNYCVEVTGACGSVTNCGTLTVLEATAATPLTSLTNCPGDNVTFNTVASGTAPFSFRWRKNGAYPADATNSSFTILAATTSDAGTYCVEVTGVCGSVTNCGALTVLTNTTSTPLSSLTNCPGASATFSTVSSGSGPVAYRWRRNGSLIVNATNSSFAIASVNSADAGTYCVEVTRACDGVTNCATLAVNPATSATPLIDMTKVVGESATFNTVASGTGPFSFMWFKDSAPLAGQTNSSITLSNLTFDHSGQYCVKVTGGCSTVTNCAQLTVTPSGLVADWKLDDGSGNTATDSSGNGHHATLLNGPVWTDGFCAGGLSFDGVNDYAQTPSTALLELAGRSFTFVLRVRSTRTGPQALVEKQHTGFSGFFLLALNRDNAVPGGVSVWTGNGWIDSNFRGLTDGQWHQVAVSYDGSAFRLYRDGILDKTMTASAPYLVTGLPLNLGRFITGGIGWFFQGQMDDVRRYNRALSGPEIAALVQCANSPPVASFSGSPTSGAVSLAVTFIDSSTGSITSRYWDFGDGATTNTSATSVMHAYGAAGTNTVSLTVSGPNGSNTLTRLAYIVVTNAAPPPPPPVASFSGTPTNGTGPLTVTFTDNSTGSITSRFWTFGDGTTTNTTATSLTHTYTGAGTNTVSLTVTGAGGSNSLIRPEYIVVTNSAAPPDFVGDWKLDDGSGTTARDSSGFGHHGTLVNGPTWTNGYCGSALSFDGVNDYVQVTNASLLEFAGRTFTMALRVRSARTGPQALVEKQYTSVSGFFLLALNRDNAVPGAVSVWTGNTWIDSNFRGLTDGQWHHVAVTYDGSSFRLYRDGILDKTMAASAPYTVTQLPLNFGRFVTANIGWYFQGQMDEIRRYNRALSSAEVADLTSCANVPPLAQFSGNTTMGYVPLTVSFTDSSTGSITNRFWNFGDGATTNTMATTLAHTYAAAGTYTVALTASGPAGSNTLTRSDYIVVTNAASPVASFNGNPTNGETPLSVTFTDTSSGIITNRFWEFGDGQTTNATTSSVSHLYNGRGTNTVSLTVRGPGGSDTLTRTSYITATSPPPRSLTVMSLNPSNGGTIAISPLDLSGQSNGVTTFNRTYAHAAMVTLTAPPTVGTNTFQRWERNATSLGTNRTVTITLDSDSTLLARYQPPGGGSAGLLGHWKLDDGSGTTATDASGLAHHGTLLNGPIWTHGQCSGALNFDGANDYMRVADADPLDFANTNFTVALWVRTTRTGAQALVEKQHNNFTGFFLLALNRDNAVPGGFSIYNGNSWIDSTFRGVTNGQWHHLAVTYDGSALRLYRDGILDQTKTGVAYYAPTTLPLNFGRFVTGNIGWYFRGEMDDIRRYNRALPTSEVASLMECPPGQGVQLASITRAPTPALRLQSSSRQADGTFRLVIRNADGTRLTPERVKRLEVYATANLFLPLEDWIKLSTRPVWVDGAAQWDDPDSAHVTQRFYILKESL